MTISPVISINKKCHSHQWRLASKCEWGLPKLRSSGCCHPQQWLLRSWGNAAICHSVRWVREQDWPQLDIWGAYGRNTLSEPRGLHLPMHRKLNSLTWYLIFDVQTACPLLVQTCILIPPPASLGQFSQSYWDAVSWAWGLKHSHQIKQFFTFGLQLHFSVNRL